MLRRSLDSPSLIQNVAPKKLAKLAWRLAIDRWHPFYTLVSSQLTVASHSHRTLVNIEFPPHLVALSCLYLASHLLTFHIPAPAIWPPDREHDRICEIAVMLNNKGDWEQRYHADVSDLEGTVHSSPSTCVLPNYRWQSFADPTMTEFRRHRYVCPLGRQNSLLLYLSYNLKSG